MRSPLAAPILAAIQLGVAAMAGFLLVRRQRSRSMPMFPVDLFKRSGFALTVATSFCSFSAQALAFVSLPFYFQDVLGRSQVDTGLLMTPWSLAVMLASPIAGRLSDRYTAGALAGIGLLLLSVGLLLVAFMLQAPSALDIT